MKLQRPAAVLLLLPLALSACGGRESADAVGERQGIQVTTAEDVAAARAANGGVEDVPAPAVAGGDTALAPPAGAGTEPAAPAGAEPKGAQPAAPAGDSDSQDRAAEILGRVERTAAGIRSLEADFVQSLTVPLLGTSQRSTGKLYQRKPDRFLMRFTDPAGDVIVADGRHFWLYYPSNDRTQVIRTSIAEGGERADFQREFVSNPTARYVATLVGEESVGGEATYVLTLVPRRASPYKILKVWVDKDDNLIRRFEMTEENDSVRRVELRNIRLNPALSDALFSFTPPPGTQVFDQ
ncbi:MAG TPA: outer membrane lipoprotein chaperone LolA [Longimicrobiaceae bacterium]|nr:outer membrane lipoprotein chaperone LolA [Longimicrobiaceae bacterium]